MPGTYVITVEKPQLAPEDSGADGLTVLATDRLTIDVKLELGVIAESVRVSGEAPLPRRVAPRGKACWKTAFWKVFPPVAEMFFTFEYDEPGVRQNRHLLVSMELYAFGNVNGVSRGSTVGNREKTRWF